MTIPSSFLLHVQHELLSRSAEYTDILYQLVHRTQEAVRLMDHQSYKRLQKMLMHGASSIEEDDKEEEIESEPPRYSESCLWWSVTLWDPA